MQGKIGLIRDKVLRAKVDGARWSIKHRLLVVGIVQWSRVRPDTSTREGMGRTPDLATYHPVPAVLHSMVRVRQVYT